MKFILAAVLFLVSVNARSQRCDCEKEFLHIKNIIETNFSGYPDKVRSLSKTTYKKNTAGFLKLTHNPFASDNCILIISQYLDMFASHHLGLSPNFDYYKIDSAFVRERPLYALSDARLAQLRQSRSWEGIYMFTHDSSYKVAVVKDATPLHDYIGVIIESKLPTWKKGMIKFEGKLTNDSIMTGLLYMRNHRPKREGFGLREHNEMISGDWRREGTVKPGKKPASSPNNNNNSLPVEARSLSNKTLYLKIESFDPELKPMIDSVMKANEQALNSTPNLVLDLRYNGGGADNLWAPLIPYLYTNPIKYVGVDLLATEATIAGWKKYLEDKNLPEENTRDIQDKIRKMEQAKGRWVSMGDDQVDSSMKPSVYPKKVLILINRWCGSSTEELLLAAQQSSKVILAGENTIGNLDYSNVVETPFSCFPYTLRYASTRSRRLNSSKGIDHVGIAPTYHLEEDADWLQEAVKILENQ